jgi:hypothetical protein
LTNSEDNDILNSSASSFSFSILSGNVYNSEDSEVDNCSTVYKTYCHHNSMTSFTLTPSNKLKFDKIFVYLLLSLLLEAWL